MPISGETSEPEETLVEEGLELLAAYRSITDRATRLAMKQVVVAVSDADAVRSAKEAPRSSFDG